MGSWTVRCIDVPSNGILMKVVVGGAMHVDVTGARRLAGNKEVAIPSRLWAGEAADEPTAGSPFVASQMVRRVIVWGRQGPWL